METASNEPWLSTRRDTRCVGSPICYFLQSEHEPQHPELQNMGQKLWRLDAMLFRGSVQTETELRAMKDTDEKIEAQRSETHHPKLYSWEAVQVEFEHPSAELRDWMPKALLETRRLLILLFMVEDILSTDIWVSWCFCAHGFWDQIESNISMSKSRWKPSVAMLEKLDYCSLTGWQVFQPNGFKRMQKKCSSFLEAQS